MNYHVFNFLTEPLPPTTTTTTTTTTPMPTTTLRYYKPKLLLIQSSTPGVNPAVTESFKLTCAVDNVIDNDVNYNDSFIR